MANDLVLSPVSVAIVNVINVAAVTDLATGGVQEDVPQNPTFPFLLYDVQEVDARGLGTGNLPLVDIRVHVYSQAETWAEAQSILREVIALLKDATLTVTSYSACGTVFYDRTVPFPDEQIHGRKCKELVAMFRAYFEEAA